MTKLILPLAVDMRIQIPRSAGLRFGGRHATILQIKSQGTTVHLGNGKLAGHRICQEPHTASGD
ncbi:MULTISPECIES: hypothetical protein [unclassified Burkholderia]|uniref:hypothetical protein n=1 Tax=unclassified Burkholderia TaxID=2613784 RepID=UPI000F56CAA7|nr:MULTISPECIES: hypothetical protein [unclassified Burkholderia]RQR35257.1 hypothetical protein DIE22_14685 [Burkholderia sp. Bp9142]RQR46474.1 hypothetical protein DIE21_29425 [Burkholderia sp. Bp9140]